MTDVNDTKPAHEAEHRQLRERLDAAVNDAGVLLGFDAIALYASIPIEEAKEAPVAICKDGTPVTAKPIIDAWLADRHRSTSELERDAAVHLKIIDHGNALVAQGAEPSVVANAMISLGAGALLKLFGRDAAMDALMSTYAPIREAVRQEASAQTETRQ